MIHCEATRFQSENTYTDPVQQRSSVSPLHGNCRRLCVHVSVCLHEHKTSGFLWSECVLLRYRYPCWYQKKKLLKMKNWGRCVSLQDSVGASDSYRPFLLYFSFFFSCITFTSSQFHIAVTLRCVPQLSQGSLQQCHIVLASVSHPSSHHEDHKLLWKLNRRQGSSLQPNNQSSISFWRSESLKNKSMCDSEVGNQASLC